MLRYNNIRLAALCRDGYESWDREFDTVKEARAFAKDHLKHPEYFDARAEVKDWHRENVLRLQILADGDCLEDWITGWTRATGTLYCADGSVESVESTEPWFTLRELNGFVGGYIEIVSAPGNKIAVMNEDGNEQGLPPNEVVTVMLAHLATGSRGVVGNVLICERGMVE